VCFFVECLPRLCLLTYQEDREEHPPVKMFLQHQSLKVFLETLGQYWLIQLNLKNAIKWCVFGRLNPLRCVDVITSTIPVCFLTDACIHYIRDLWIGNFHLNRITNQIGGYDLNLNRILNRIRVFQCQELCRPTVY